MSSAPHAFIVLNAGSSSLKFALYDAGSLDQFCRGGIDAIGLGARFKVKGTLADAFADTPPLPDDETHSAIVAWLIDAVRTSLPDTVVVAAGHRVVHGGAQFDTPVLVDDSVMKELERLVPLAPAHQPHNLAAIRAVGAAWPGLPQVACFDTAFHRTQPRLAQLFALPRELTDEGVLRYGFHGLSYDYIASRLPDVAGLGSEDRVVVAHLGHGASLCAMRNGHSLATTMGFTAIDGLVMGKRCGSLDPGVILHLMREKGMSVADVDELLNRRSGLLGVSGISDDVRDLEASDDPAATEALDLFAYRAARELGSLAAALGGLDAFVFTAGIGEHSATTRSRICSFSTWTGMALDGAANAAHQTRISSAASSIGVFVIPTDEEVVIARGMRSLGL